MVNSPWIRYDIILQRSHSWTKQKQGIEKQFDRTNYNTTRGHESGHIGNWERRVTNKGVSPQWANHSPKQTSSRLTPSQWRFPVEDQVQVSGSVVVFRCFIHRALGRRFSVYLLVLFLIPLAIFDLQFVVVLDSQLAPSSPACIASAKGAYIFLRLG